MKMSASAAKVAKSLVQDSTFKDQCMKFEQKVLDLERKNSNLIDRNKEFRRQHEKKEKEAAALQLRVDKLSEHLRSAEVGRKVAEDYARKLEAKFEKSGRGVALLKAARLQSDLEAAQQQNQMLLHTVSCKDTEIDNIKGMIAELQHVLGRSAHGLGLPDGQALAEYLKLKDQFADIQQQLTDKETTITSLMDELAMAEGRANQAAILESQVASLQEAINTQNQAAREAIDDKNTLLDYVQELQDERDKLCVEARDNQSQQKQAQAVVEQLRTQIQTLGHDKQQAEAQVEQLMHALTSSGIAEIQQKLAAAEALCHQRDIDLQELQNSSSAAMETLQTRLHDKDLHLVEMSIQRDTLQRQMIETQAQKQRLEATLHEQNNRLADQQQQVAALQAKAHVMESEAGRAAVDIRQKETLSRRVEDMEGREAALLKLVDELRNEVAALERQLQTKEADKEAAELLCGDLVHAIRLHRNGSLSTSAAPPPTSSRVPLTALGTEVRLLLEDLGRAGYQLRVGRDLQDEVARQADDARARLADAVAVTAALEAENNHLKLQIDSMKAELQNLREDHLSLVKQMECQLRTLYEIDSLLPSTTAMKADGSLEDRLVAEVRHHMQEAAAARAQLQDALQCSAVMTQQLHAARDEITAMELVVKPSNQKLQTQLEEAMLCLTEAAADKAALQEALQREKEHVERFKADMEATIDQLESTVAASRDELEACRQKADEQLCLERQHCRNLQIELERVRDVAQEKEAEAQQALQVAEQTEVKLQQERRFQVTELRASLRARQARVKELEKQHEPRTSGRRSSNTSTSSAQPPLPPSPAQPNRALPQPDPSQLVQDLAHDLLSSSDDEDDSATGKVAKPRAGPRQLFEKQAGKSRIPSALADDEQQSASRSQQQPISRAACDVAATSIAFLPRSNSPMGTAPDIQPNRAGWMLRAGSPPSQRTPPTQRQLRHSHSELLSPPASMSPVLGVPASRTLTHSTTTLTPSRPGSTMRPSGGMHRESLATQRPASAQQGSLPNNAGSITSPEASKRPLAIAKSPSSSALLQQLQQLHASHKELRSKFQRVLSISSVEH